MRTFINIFVLSLFLLTLSACQEESSSVPLILYNEDDPYIDQFKEHIMTYSEGRVSIVPYDSQNSQVLQNEWIDELLLSNPKVLIVNPVDRLGAYTIIDQAKAQGIPVVFINREPLPEDMERYDQVYYLGAPAETGALIQAEMVVELFGNPTDLSELDRNNDNRIQLMIFKGEQGHQDAEIRTEVIVEELERLGYDLDILSIEICDWQKQLAETRMSDFLSNYEELPNIEIVVSNNDYMAIGAIDSLVEHGYFVDDNEDTVLNQQDASWIPVLGIDAIDEAKIYMEDGFLYGTVLNDSETMSIYLVDLIVALLDNQDLTTLDFTIDEGNYIWVDYKKYQPE